MRQQMLFASKIPITSLSVSLRVRNRWLSGVPESSLSHCWNAYSLSIFNPVRISSSEQDVDTNPRPAAVNGGFESVAGMGGIT